MTSPAPAATRSAPASPRMSHGVRARSARAASSPCTPAALQTSRQIACASSSRGMSTSRSPLLMVTDSRCGNANSHSTRPPTTPRIGGGIPGRIEAEMRVDDGAEFRRRLQARQQRRRRARRHRQHDDIVGRRARSCRSPNFNSPIALPVVANSRSSWPNWIAGALVLQQLDRGSTSTALSPSRAISGRQACPPASSVSRTIAPARPAEPSGGSTLSAASSSGCTSRWYSVPSQGIASPTSLSGACPDQRRQCQIIEQLGIGDAARLVEHPERQSAVAEVELPALAGR